MSAWPRVAYRQNRTSRAVRSVWREVFAAAPSAHRKADRQPALVINRLSAGSCVHRIQFWWLNNSGPCCTATQSAIVSSPALKETLKMVRPAADSKLAAIQFRVLDYSSCPKAAAHN